MLTFNQYLTEKFFDGVKSSIDYAEIYVNPDKYELIELSQKINGHELGAWVTSKKIYVWDRDFATHYDVWFGCKKAKMNAEFLPIYLYYNKDTNVVRVDLTNWSASPVQTKEFRTHSKLVAFCKAHPAFKNFTVK